MVDFSIADTHTRLLPTLRSSRRPSSPFVSQDLIVDQTIEKVSFCAPDRNYDKAFSYICRDGTTRRWMCHCFMALKDSVRRDACLLLLRFRFLAAGLKPRYFPSKS